MYLFFQGICFCFVSHRDLCLRADFSRNSFFVQSRTPVSSQKPVDAKVRSSTETSTATAPSKKKKRSSSSNDDDNDNDAVPVSGNASSKFFFLFQKPIK